MLIEIPFVHEACVTRRGCRNDEVVGVSGTVPVQIAEAKVAPVAARWSGEVATGRNGGVVEHWEYRAWRGGLVTPWRPQSRWGLWIRLEPVTADDLQNTLNGLGHRGAHLNPFTPKAKDREDPNFERIVPANEPIREVHWDKRGEGEDLIRRRASRWVIADGLACEPTNGPVWNVVSNNSVREDSPILVEAVPWSGTSLECKLRTYRADRFEDAMAHARALAEECATPHGKPRPEILVSGEIELLDPDAFTFDDDGRALRAAAGAFLLKNQERLHGFPADAGKAYFDLRDAAQEVARQRGIGLDWDRAGLLAASRAAADAHPLINQGNLVLKVDELREAVDRIDRGFAPVPAIAAPGL